MQNASNHKNQNKMFKELTVIWDGPYIKNVLIKKMYNT